MFKLLIKFNEMSTKLFIYKVKMPYDANDNTILFSTLANDEEEAKNFILNKVENEVYLIALKKHFEDDANKPIIYEHGGVFIQYVGELKLFTQ